MDSRETEQKNRKSIANNIPGDAIVLRRPYGVAAIDITLYLSGRIETNEETHHFIPLLQYVHVKVFNLIAHHYC